MKIDDIDAFRSWLTATLNPLFHADIDRLADYIIALLKKDRTQQQLKDICNKQLDIFLESKTTDFVEDLFTTLNSKSYLNNNNNNKQTNNEIFNENNNDSKPRTSSKSPPRSSTTTTTTTTTTTRSNSQDDSSSAKRLKSSTSRSSTNGNNNKSKSSKTTSSSSNRTRNHRASYSRSSSSSSTSSSSTQSSSSSSSRSRSPAYRHSQLQEHNKNNDETSSSTANQSQDKQQQSSSIQQSNNNHSGDSTQQKPWRNKRDKHNNGGNNNQYKKPYHRPHHQQQQPQLQRGGQMQFNDQSLMQPTSNQQPPLYLMRTSGAPPLQQQQQHDTNSIGTYTNAQPQIISSLITTNVLSNIPITHPQNPSQLYQQSGGGQSMQQQRQHQHQHQQNALNMNRQQASRPRSLVNIVTHDDSSSNTMISNNSNRNEERQNRSQNYPHRGMKRSYTNDSQTIKPQIPSVMDPIMLNPAPGGGGGGVGLGLPSMPFQIPNSTIPQTNPNINQGGNKNMNSNTIFIRKIPKEMNSEPKLREHFQKFGKIVKIEVNYESSPDAALVQYSSIHEAQSAYKCPQPVFNNRFIRLYLHNNNQQQQQQQQQHNYRNQQHQQQQHPQQQQSASSDGEPQLKKHVKDRLVFEKSPKIEPTIPAPSSLTLVNVNTSQNKENKLNESVDESSTAELSEKTNTGGGDTTTPTTPTTQTKQLMADKLRLQQLTLKEKQDETQRKALILKLELSGKTQKLIDEQIKQQKYLLGKLDQCKTVEEKSAILETIKKLTELIEQEKKSIVKQSSDFLKNAKALSSDTTKRPPSKVIKPAKAPITIANAKFYKLVNNKEAYTSFLSATTRPAVVKPVKKPPITPHNSAIALSHSRISIDHRPKELLVEDIENEEEKELIINHFKSLSNVEDVKDFNEKSIVFNFLTRKDAEMAFINGSTFNNKKLKLSWHKSIKQQGEENVTPTGVEETIEAAGVDSGETSGDADVSNEVTKDNQIEETDLTTNNNEEEETQNKTSESLNTTTTTTNENETITSTNNNNNPPIKTTNNEGFDAQISINELDFEEENDNDLKNLLQNEDEEEEESRPWRY